MSDDEALPDGLRDWVQATASTRISQARCHVAGASRQAWSIDSDAGGLFLLRDALSASGGSARDATVLRALAHTPLPVPRVYGNDTALGTLLLERISGRSDFPNVDNETEREPTARHLMELTAALHAIDPTSLAIAHLGAPADPASLAPAQLAQLQGSAATLGDAAAPLFSFAIAWLARNVPAPPPRTALVHSDMGPGNFIYQGGRVTAVLDWEVAHWGDPMEDLAAISIRDMATPVGDLPTRYGEYEAAAGESIRYGALRWYRVFVLTRNPLLITLGLRRKDAAVNRAPLEMYRLNLMRACSLALCDAVGIRRPLDEPRLDPNDEHPYKYAPIEEELDLREMAALLGHRPADVYEAWKHLVPLFDDPAHDAGLAEFFARHLLRRGYVGAAILGPLADRLPQPLVRE